MTVHGLPTAHSLSLDGPGGDYDTLGWERFVPGEAVGETLDPCPCGGERIAYRHPLDGHMVLAHLPADGDRTKATAMYLHSALLQRYALAWSSLDLSVPNIWAHHWRIIERVAHAPAERVRLLRITLGDQLRELAQARQELERIAGIASLLNICLIGGEESGDRYPEDSPQALERATRRIHALGQRLSDTMRELREVRAAIENDGGGTDGTTNDDPERAAAQG